METIRPANIDDLIRCSELLGILFSQERAFTPDPIVQRLGLERIIKKRFTIQGKLLVPLLKQHPLFSVLYGTAGSISIKLPSL